MPPSSAGRSPLTASSCPRCGRGSAAPFSAAGVCLRCAGTRVLALETEIAPVPAAAGPATSGDLPDRIGTYEIIEELGRGGMGRVLAARQGNLARIVALKVLPAGRGQTADLELRFLREAQTVAGLRHPHVIAIHDSGRVDGYAYFSMDYIEGGDLARRARAQPFTPTAAATLLQKVAAALAYTHAAGVLHRDLKPSNILLDGDEPRVADFGLAAQLEAGGDLTAQSGVLGTPHYLAPEALRGGSAALSVASDIYALGVVMFELLTGRTPFAGSSPAELAALVERTEPPAPRLLAPAVPRDLETICLKCLERDPARRYADAGALAADLGRFLNGEPIVARPVSPSGRFLRWCRRRPALAAVWLLVCALAVASTLSALALARERARTAKALAAAQQSDAASRAVVDFLENDLLAQAAPDQQPNRDLPLRTVLDRATAKIDGRFAGQPAVEASLRETLAATYESLGELAAEQRQLEKALALRRGQTPPDEPAVLKLLDRLAAALASQGKLKEADPLARDAAARSERLLGLSHPATLHAYNDLIYTLKAQGLLAEAESTGRRTLAAARPALGPDHNETRDAMSNLASVLFSARKLAEAEALNVEALAAQQRVLGPEHPDTLIVMSNLASVYWAEDKFPEAEKINVQILDIRRRLLGPEHPETLRSMANLATTLDEEGKRTEAIALLTQVWEIRRRVRGPEHADTLSAAMNLASIYYEDDRLDEATLIATQTLDTARRVLGPDHFLTLATVFNLARFQRAAGHLAAAETLFSEVLQARRRLSGPENMQTLQAADGLGDTLVLAGRFAEAHAVLEPCLATRVKLTPKSWRTDYTRSLLGAALAGERDFAAAEPLLVESYRALAAQAAQIPVNSRPIVAQAGGRLVQLYSAWGKTEEAAQWREKTASPGAVASNSPASK